MRLPRCFVAVCLALAAASAALAAPSGMVDLTPVESGPGLLVAEPVPAPGAEDLADFGVGCARILHFHLASTKAFGKTPPWFAVDHVRRSLGRTDVRLKQSDMAAFAAPLGITHVALGTISGNDKAATLTYEIREVTGKKVEGEPLTMSGKPLTLEGTPAEIVAGLQNLGMLMVVRLGGGGAVFPDITASVADVTALGKMPWSLDSDASVADLDTAERLAAVLPVAAVAALPAASPRRGARLAALLNKSSAFGRPMAMAELAWFYPAGVSRQTAAVAHPANHLLYAAATAAMKQKGSREQMLAAAQVVRCAPDSAEAWRYLSNVLDDVGQAVRKSRAWMDIPEEDQEFLVAVYPLVLSAARRAADLAPRDPRMWTRLANAATFADETAEADMAIRHALKLAPNHTNAYAWALQMYQPKWGGEEDDLAEMVAAAAARPLLPAASAVAIATTMKSIGFGEDAKKLLTRTAADLTAILKAHPKDPDTLQALAEAKEALGDRKEALTTYRRLVEAAPEDAAARIALANALYYGRNYAESAAAAREAVRLSPKTADGHLSLAWALFEEKQYADAEKAAREAIRLDPERANARYVLARSLFPQEGRREEAYSSYREAIRLSPRYAAALRQFGYDLRVGKRYDESEKVLLRAIAAQPENDFGYRYLFMTMRDTRQWAKAAEALELYIEHVPDDPWGHRRLGDMLLELGETEDAREAWNEAVRLDPDSADGKAAKESLTKNTG